MNMYSKNVKNESYYKDAWDSKDVNLLLKAYEEYPDDNPSNDKKIREMLQILIDNNIKYNGNYTRNNDIVNIVRNLVEIPNPEIDINKITSIHRTVYPKFADDYDLFDWFADGGDEFFVISMSGKKHLVLMSDDGINIFTPERANKFVDDMIKTGYMEEDDPDISEIRDKFIQYAKRYSNRVGFIESKGYFKLNQLKESLPPVKFNKIQQLIKECLKEGMEVEITIPKNKCKNLNESLTEEEKDELEIFLKNAEGNFPNKTIPMTYMRTQSKNNSSKISILINQLGDNDLKVACKELGYRVV